MPVLTQICSREPSSHLSTSSREISVVGIQDLPSPVPPTGLRNEGGRGGGGVTSGKPQRDQSDLPGEFIAEVESVLSAQGGAGAGAGGGGGDVAWLAPPPQRFRNTRRRRKSVSLTNEDSQEGQGAAASSHARESARERASEGARVEGEPPTPQEVLWLSCSSRKLLDSSDEDTVDAQPATGTGSDRGGAAGDGGTNIYIGRQPRRWVEDADFAKEEEEEEAGARVGGGMSSVLSAASGCGDGYDPEVWQQAYHEALRLRNQERALAAAAGDSAAKRVRRRDHNRCGPVHGSLGAPVTSDYDWSTDPLGHTRQGGSQASKAVAHADTSPPPPPPPPPSHRETERASPRETERYWRRGHVTESQRTINTIDEGSQESRDPSRQTSRQTSRTTSSHFSHDREFSGDSAGENHAAGFASLRDRLYGLGGSSRVSLFRSALETIDDGCERTTPDERQASGRDGVGGANTHFQGRVDSTSTTTTDVHRCDNNSNYSISGGERSSSWGRSDGELSVRSGVSSTGTGATAATGALVWSRDMPGANDILVKIKVPEGWTRKSKSHGRRSNEASENDEEEERRRRRSEGGGGEHADDMSPSASPSATPRDHWEGSEGSDDQGMRYIMCVCVCVCVLHVCMCIYTHTHTYV